MEQDLNRGINEGTKFVKSAEGKDKKEIDKKLKQIANKYELKKLHLVVDKHDENGLDTVHVQGKVNPDKKGDKIKIEIDNEDADAVQLSEVSSKINNQKTFDLILKAKKDGKINNKAFRNLVKKIKNEELTNGFRIEQSIVDDSAHEKVLQFNYFGLNLQGATPALSYVYRRPPKDPIGFAFLSKENLLKTDLLVPKQIEKAYIKGVGTSMFQGAEETLRDQMSGVEGLWTDADIYKGRTEHNMSDNLHAYIKAMEEHGNKYEAAKKTWTYRRAEEQGYSVVKDVKDDTIGGLRHVRATFVKPYK